MGRFTFMALLFCGMAHAQLTQQPTYLKLGSSVPIIDKNGVTWNADTCTGDSPIVISGVYSSPIYNSAGFNSITAAPILCNFSVLPGIYRVTFHLIEAFTSFNTPKRRIFDILLNGQPLVSNVDIFVRSGAVRTAYDLLTTVRSDGPLTFSFVSRVNPAMVAAIEITPLFEFNATSPPLWFLPPTGDPIPLSSISFNGDALISYGQGSVQVGFNTAVLAKRDAMQSGPASPVTNGNPQTCAPQPLPDNPDAPLTPGLDYIAACSTALTRLDKYQVLNWIVETVNAGPVSLAIDTFPAMPVLNRQGNALNPGDLVPGLYRIWNDGTNWRVSEL